MVGENTKTTVLLPDEQRVLDAQARFVVARQRTQVALQVLQDEVAEKADWHTWFQARPVLFLSVAFVAGYLMAKR